ncbi:MAG TPA: hypothetical protein VOA87_18465 [Thermoanaerobaculia bacterium]|nr:hypothetical protein [Thermoanaerobaculia bacterium]
MSQYPRSGQRPGNRADGPYIGPTAPFWHNFSCDRRNGASDDEREDDLEASYLEDERSSRALDADLRAAVERGTAASVARRLAADLAASLARSADLRAVASDVSLHMLSRSIF